MANNRALFYVSGLFSLALFTLILLLFFKMMFSSQPTNVFAFNKDNFISVSIEMPITKIEKTKTSNATPLIVDSAQAQEEDAVVDIDDLFSDVWTKKITKSKAKKKEVNNRVIQQIQKKIAIKKDNQSQSFTDKIDEINKSDLKDNKESAASTANEVNEYLAKIQALVYKYFYPPQNSQGHSVKAVINLSSIGKVLDFRILNYSSNSSLNSESDKIKSRLMSVLFPINPQSKSGNYIIILKSEE